MLTNGGMHELRSANLPLVLYSISYERQSVVVTPIINNRRLQKTLQSFTDSTSYGETPFMNRHSAHLLTAFPF